jgi:hypothetical protein
MDKFFVALVAAVVGIATIVFISFLLSWPVYALWNSCLVGAVTGINEVSWVQAWGISLLSGFLFKTTVSNSK